MSQGFSTAEMMVSLAVFVLLTVAAGGVFDTSQDSLNWNYQQLTLQNELRKILLSMSQEIKESSPNSPSPIITGANTITFQIPTSVSANQVTGWRQITYGLATDNTVTRTVNGQTNIIGNSVQALNFTYPVNAATAPRTVQIQIVGNRVTLKRNITATVTGQVNLRN